MLFDGIWIKLLESGRGCFFNAEKWECVTADAILNAQDKIWGEWHREV